MLISQPHCHLQQNLPCRCAGDTICSGPWAQGRGTSAQHGSAMFPSGLYKSRAACLCSTASQPEQITRPLNAWCCGQCSSWWWLAESWSWVVMWCCFLIPAGRWQCYCCCHVIIITIIMMMWRRICCTRKLAQVYPIQAAGSQKSFPLSYFLHHSYNSTPTWPHYYDYYD